MDASLNLDVTELEDIRASERAHTRDALDFRRPSISVSGRSSRAEGEMN